MYGNSHIHIKTDVLPCESTNKRAKIVPLHHMQRNSLIPCKKHIKTLLGALSCSGMRNKGFPFKIYLEDHEPEVNGNTSACLQNYDTMCQNSNQGYRERKTHEIREN